MKLHRGFSFGAIVALLFAASTKNARAAAGDYDREDDLTEAVVACEDAFARLENCCPGYSSFVGEDRRRSPCSDYEWRHTTGDDGCYSNPQVDTGSVKPLSLSESKCITDTSCDELVARGVCDRVRGDKNTTTKRSLCL